MSLPEAARYGAQLNPYCFVRRRTAVCVYRSCQLFRRPLPAQPSKQVRLLMCLATQKAVLPHTTRLSLTKGSDTAFLPACFCAQACWKGTYLNPSWFLAFPSPTLNQSSHPLMHHSPLQPTMPEQLHPCRHGNVRPLSNQQPHHAQR